MTIAGHLVGITTDRFGSELTADVAIGDTEVQVASTIFFNEREGGTLLLNGTPLAYQAFDDPDTDDDQVGDDDGPTTLTLVGSSPIDADEGDRVYELDSTTGADGDPVQEVTALVTVDDRDGGDALPARVRAGLTDQLVSDFQTYVGKAVELEHRRGELVLVDIFGSKRTGDDKYDQDETVAVGPGGVVQLDLKYIPIKNSEHLYVGGVYQRGAKWTRDRWTVSIPDEENRLRAGIPIAMEYAYRDPAPRPPSTYSAPVSHDRTGHWNAYPTSFLTSWPLPDDAVVGDLLVAVSFGEGDGGNPAITDPRMTTIAEEYACRVAVGYATDLSDMTCHVGGVDLPVDQFAGMEIISVHGDAEGVAWDPTKLAISYIGSHADLDTIVGAGNGAIIAVVAGVINGITLDWATYVPDFTDWGGTIATPAILGHFGYSSNNSPPAQRGPTNTTTLAVVIGLK